MKIAIIGMGVAGISVLREWIKEKTTNPSLEITVFGDQDTFGTGIPYQEDNKNLLMNVPAEFTTIIPEEEDDFVQWLKDTQDEENPRLGYYPRMLFGAYLKERMNTWLEESKAEVIKEKIETIRILSNNRFRLTWSSGVDDFHVVHLCIGSLPYKDHYDLIENPNFIIDPFPLEKNLSLIPHGAAIGVLGTGLTSIDIFRYTYYERPDLKVSFFSPSGRFKSVSVQSEPINYKYFTPENITKAKEENNGFIPLDTYIDWFKKEIENQSVSLKSNFINEPFGSRMNMKKQLEGSNEIGVIQALLLDMNPFLTELWMSIDEKDKQTFLDKYYGIWDKLRSSFPAESGAKLVSAWDENKVNVYNNLIDIVQERASFKFILEDQEPVYKDYIINGAGTEKTVSVGMDGIPLISQLLNHRIIQAESFGGVQVILPELSAISQKYGVLHNFKIHGGLISGIQFGNNSVDIISETAGDAVKNIVQIRKDK